MVGRCLQPEEKRVGRDVEINGLSGSHRHVGRQAMGRGMGRPINNRWFISQIRRGGDATVKLAEILVHICVAEKHDGSSDSRVSYCVNKRFRSVLPRWNETNRSVLFNPR